jgi:addiction module HigA family antidote
VAEMSAKKLPPIHPGEILLEEFLKPMDISQYRLAKAVSVPARRINEIVHGKRSVSADTALRLRRTGYELHKVQNGLEPDNWKPMTSVGSGVKEIRVSAPDGIYRAIYVAKFKDAVYVLHAFQKKEQKTRQEDIDLAKKRLKEIGGK